MPRVTKRKKRTLEIFGSFYGKKVKAVDAFKLLKETVSSKCKESFDVSINLGIDVKKSDQAVRGVSVLPKGNGRPVKVAVFTSGKNVEIANDSGADLVGSDELFTDIKASIINFDVLIASPDVMPTVAKLGQILGPKGLMPNPKDGTVTNDVRNAIKNAKSGQVNFRSDKFGIVHCSIGNTEFDTEDLLENLFFLLNDLKKAKPATSKGIFIKKIFISTTMGIGVEIEQPNA